MRDSLKDPSSYRHAVYTGNISYSKFIEGVISKGNQPPYAQFLSQWDFVSLEESKIGVDYIFPMDRMDLVSAFLSQSLGELIEIPKLNVTPKTNIELNLKLDPELKGELASFLRKDIELFDLVKKHGYYDRSLHQDTMSLPQYY
jgi:hypothetical protein